MRKLNKAQKVIFISGIIGVLVAIYGKLNGWDYDDYFIPFYTGSTFMWIAFLDTNTKCERTLIRKLFGKTLTKK